MSSPNENAASAPSAATTAAPTRLRSQRSAGPSWAGSGATRGASGAIVEGRAPSTKRAAFHSLFAKLRAFSSFSALNFWSFPGAAPWIRAKRSASAPASSMASSGSTTLPVVFDIFWP